jgi:hypothetical protein
MTPAKTTVTVTLSSALILLTGTAARAMPAPPLEWMFEGSVPANGATAVHPDQPLVIVAGTFGNALNEEDLTQTRVDLFGAEGEQVTGALRLAPFGQFFVFEPSAPLRLDTDYQWTVTHPHPHQFGIEVSESFAFRTGQDLFEVARETAVVGLHLTPSLEPVFGECAPDDSNDDRGACEAPQVGELSVIGVWAHLQLGTHTPQVFGTRIGLGATADEAVAVAERTPIQPLFSLTDGTANLGAGQAEARSWGSDQACVAVIVTDMLDRIWLEGSMCVLLPAWVPVEWEDPVDAPAEVDAPADVDAGSRGCNARGATFAPLLGLLLPFGLLRRRRTNSR